MSLSSVVKGPVGAQAEGIDEAGGVGGREIGGVGTDFPSSLD